MATDSRSEPGPNLRLVFLLFVLGIVVAVALGLWLHDDPAKAWQTSGGILEIIGLGLAGIQLDAKLAHFTGRPTIGQRLVRGLQAAYDWLLSAFGRRATGGGKIVNVKGTAVGTSALSARVSVRPAKDADVERWIEYLDAELEALRERVQEIRKKQRERMDALEGQLKVTRRQLRDADEELRDFLERAEIGGFEWELVGLAWFVVGVIFATWGQDLPL